ncbi:SLAM family member 9-like [Heterodontus francisci]|uniref:SLAM family member 9-like n=1 Tax=Heterodontus francisci TaxID=7792 RepID=UPI00355AD0BA
MKYSDWKAMEILRLFAVLHCITLCSAATSAPLNSVANLRTGEDVRFPINYHSDEKYEVTFRRRSPISLKILAWNSEQPDRPYRIHPYYTQRVQFHRDGFIELQSVHLDDEGVYEIQTDYLGRQLRNNNQDLFELHVFEPVSQPLVVITGNCSSNRKLNCSISRGTKVTCRWQSQSVDGVSNYTFHGAVLQLGNLRGQEPHTYTCIVENPVSEESSEPVTAELCDGDQDRGPRNHWISVLIAAFSFIILASVMALGIWRRQRMRNSKQSCGGRMQECEVLRVSPQKVSQNLSV